MDKFKQRTELVYRLDVPVGDEWVKICTYIYMKMLGLIKGERTFMKILQRGGNFKNKLAFDLY
jgi:hypothetical protein